MSRNGELIGRAQQRGLLHSALLDAQGGRGRLVLLSGEPGIGKTRLAEDTESRALKDGIQVCWGRCHEREGQPPFWPWVQVLRDYALQVGPGNLTPLLEVETQPLTRLIPELHDPTPLPSPDLAADSESARFRLFLGMSALLRRLAVRRPLLLILDDLHWADSGSLRLLDFLSYEIRSLPLLVLATFREADAKAREDTEILASLRRRAETIPLTGLTADEVATFLAHTGDAPLSQGWTKRLHEITDGNPLFLGEMARWLGSHPEIGPQEASLPLPEGILGAIRQRLLRLPTTLLPILGAAAVSGRDLNLSFLASLLDIPPQELGERLQPAIEADLLRGVAERPGDLRFAHALTQEALRSQLPVTRQLELHRRCAETLERKLPSSDPGVLNAIAHHYFAASALGDGGRAADYCQRAGEEAMRALAFEAAAIQFSRCLRLLEDLAQRDRQREGEIWLRLGDAHNRGGAAEDAAIAFQRAVEIARDTAAPVSLARAAIGLSGIGSTWAQFGRHDPHLVEVLRDALAALGEKEDGLRARVMARLASELHFGPSAADAHRLSSAAVALARQVGDPSTLVYTLPARLRCSTPEERQERIAIAEEILALTSAQGELAVHAYVWRLSEALQSGDMLEAQALRDRLLAAVRQLRQPRELWLIPALEGQRHLLRADLTAAEDAAEAVLRHEGLSPNGRMAGFVLLFLIRREQGRLEELVEGIRAFAYQSAGVNAWRAHLALLYAESGQTDLARTELQSLVEADHLALRRDNTWLLGIAGLAEAAALAGTQAQCARLYDVLRPFDGRHIVAASFFYLGPVAYYLGCLGLRAGRPGLALAHLDQALAQARAVVSPAYLARTLIARAGALLDLDPNHREGAAESTQEARKLIAEHGLVAILKRLADAQPSPAPASEVVLPPASAPAFKPQRAASLAWEREVWALTYEGRTSLLKARRGLDYLARLLASPHEPFHVLDLSSPSSPLARDPGFGEAVFDSRAKREARARFLDLRTQLAEAEDNNDLGRTTRLRDELAALTQHLTEALGQGGKDRRFVTATQRARAAVTKALRAAIQQIAPHEPDLAALLGRTVHTGTFCSYAPLNEAPIDWDIQPPREI